MTIVLVYAAVFALALNLPWAVLWLLDRHHARNSSSVVFDSGLALSDVELSIMVYREQESDKAYMIIGNAEIDRFAAFEMTTWAVLEKWFEEHGEAE